MFPIWLLGVLLAIGASFVSNLGLNLQKRAHMNMSSAKDAKDAKTKSDFSSSGSHHTRSHTMHPRRLQKHHSISLNNGNDITPVVFSDSSSEPVNDESDKENSSSSQKTNTSHTTTTTTTNGILKKPKSSSNGYHLIDSTESSPSKHDKLNLPHPPVDKHSPQFKPAEPKSYTSISEVAQGSIDLDAYGKTRVISSGRSSPAHSNGTKKPIARARSYSAAAPSHKKRRSSAIMHDGPLNPASGASAKPDGHYTKQPIWIIGIVCVFLGSLLDFAALAFVDQSVVAPLGSLTLVSNVFFAPLLLKEKVNRKQLYCTALIIIGSILAVAFAPHSTEEPKIDEMFDNFARPRFIVYAVICAVSLILLRVACWKFGRIRRTDPMGAYQKLAKSHTFAYAACAGIMGAQSVLFAKCTAMLLAGSIAGNGLMFVHWGTYFILLGLGVTIFLQIRWLNSGLRMFSALLIVPIFQSFWILISVLSGMIFFGEYAGVFESIPNAILFPLGIFLTIVGVYFLTQITAPAEKDGESSQPVHRKRSRSNAHAGGTRNHSISGHAGLNGTGSQNGLLSPASTNGSSNGHDNDNATVSHYLNDVTEQSIEDSFGSNTSVSSHGSHNGGGVPSTPLLVAATTSDNYGVPSPRDVAQPRKSVRLDSKPQFSSRAVSSPGPKHALSESGEHAIDVGSYSPSPDEVEEDEREEREQERRRRAENGETNEEEDGEEEDGNGSDDSGGSSGSDDVVQPLPSYPDYAVHSLAPLNFPLFLLPRHGVIGQLMDETPTPGAYFESNSSGFDSMPNGQLSSSVPSYQSSMFQQQREQKILIREDKEVERDAQQPQQQQRHQNQLSQPQQRQRQQDVPASPSMTGSRGPQPTKAVKPAANNHSSSIPPSPQQQPTQPPSLPSHHHLSTPQHQQQKDHHRHLSGASQQHPFSTATSAASSAAFTPSILTSPIMQFASPMSDSGSSISSPSPHHDPFLLNSASQSDFNRTDSSVSESHAQTTSAQAVASKSKSKKVRGNSDAHRGGRLDQLSERLL